MRSKPADARTRKREEQNRARWEARQAMKQEWVYESGPGWNSVTFPAAAPPAPAADNGGTIYFLPTMADSTLYGDDIHPDARRLLRALGFVAGEVRWDKHSQLYREETGPEQVNRAVDVEIPATYREVLELRALLTTAGDQVRRLQRELNQYSSALDSERLVTQQLSAEIMRQRGKTPPATGPRAFFDEG